MGKLRAWMNEPKRMGLPGTSGPDHPYICRPIQPKFPRCLRSRRSGHRPTARRLGAGAAGAPVPGAWDNACKRASHLFGKQGSQFAMPQISISRCGRTLCGYSDSALRPPVGQAEAGCTGRGEPHEDRQRQRPPPRQAGCQAQADRGRQPHSRRRDRHVLAGHGTGPLDGLRGCRRRSTT